MAAVNRIERVLTAYRAATGKWTSADWAHYSTGIEQRTSCDGDDPSCAVCAEARQAAWAAEVAAARCIAAAEAGDWDEALMESAAALDIERLFNRRTVWSQLVDAVLAARRRSDLAVGAP